MFDSFSIRLKITKGCNKSHYNLQNNYHEVVGVAQW